jgi:hypothetical protein
MQVSLSYHVRSHSLCRYAFRSLEKAALQEIGPRFTLKLRWLKKGAPAVKDLGAPPPPLLLASDVPEGEEASSLAESCQPPKGDEYLWQWKVRIMFILSTTCMFSFGCYCSPSWRFHDELFSCEARIRLLPLYVICPTSGGYSISYCLNIRGRVTYAWPRTWITTRSS